MKIAIDITILHIAQAGIFYYHYNLVRALLDRPSPHQFLLLDYHPIHGGWTNPPEMTNLTAPHAEVRQVKGLRHRKLSRLWFMQRPLLWPLAKGVDQVLLHPWSKLAEWVMQHQLHKHLDGVALFHASSVVPYALPHAKNVTTIYDLTPLLFPEHHTMQTRDLYRRFFRFAQTEADAVIVISEATKRDVITHLDLEPERVHVVHAGVDPRFHPLDRTTVAQALASLELQPQRYILHVGTIEPRKNLVRLIEAYHRLRQEVSPPVPQLVLAGALGWMSEEVFRRVKALGLEDDVRFVGRVEGAVLPALYNGARLFAYPSLYEGFGMPVLEAMACGTPVVTSNVSSLPEVAGDACLLVDPTDVRQVAQAMARLLEDDALRDRLRQKGLARAAQFRWDRAATKALQVYDGLLAG